MKDANDFFQLDIDYYNWEFNDFFKGHAIVLVAVSLEVYHQQLIDLILVCWVFRHPGYHSKAVFSTLLAFNPAKTIS